MNLISDLFPLSSKALPSAGNTQGHNDKSRVLGITDFMCFSCVVPHSGMQSLACLMLCMCEEPTPDARCALTWKPGHNINPAVSLSRDLSFLFFLSLVFVSHCVYFCLSLFPLGRSSSGVAPLQSSFRTLFGQLPHYREHRECA